MTGTGRLGIFGGTFDPIHLGHLDAARTARRALVLDRVLIVPARVPPHRSTAPQASAFHRFAMAALALADEDRVAVSDVELLEPGPSYTARTLRRLHAEGWAPTQLFFLIGTDAFAEIATWQDYPALLELANFAVVTRPGFALETLVERVPELAGRMLVSRPVAGSPEPRSASGGPEVTVVPAATSDVSSTVVRARIASGRPVRDLVPERVDHYIRRQGLYRAAGDHEPR